MQGPYLPVEPAKLVQVEREGVWHQGFLEGWRLDEGRWDGFCALAWPWGCSTSNGSTRSAYVRKDCHDGRHQSALSSC
jgi:hypothetical protein